jgi:hypothetical protein
MKQSRRPKDSAPSRPAAEADRHCSTVADPCIVHVIQARVRIAHRYEDANAQGLRTAFGNEMVRDAQVRTLRLLRSFSPKGFVLFVFGFPGRHLHFCRRHEWHKCSPMLFGDDLEVIRNLRIS